MLLRSISYLVEMLIFDMRRVIKAYFRVLERLVFRVSGAYKKKQVAVFNISRIRKYGSFKLKV